jgi:hypothetical protein
MAGRVGSVRRPLRTKVFLEHMQEMMDEERALRECALVFTVSGTCPLLVPGNISEGLRTDFPALPHDTFQISLRQPGVFFVRFSEPR